MKITMKKSIIKNLKKKQQQEKGEYIALRREK